MPAACSAVRTATRSVASLTTSKDSPEVVDLLGTGVEDDLEHVVLGQPSPLGTMTTPLRVNR